jgi:hypothetical protein
MVSVVVVTVFVVAVMVFVVVEVDDGEENGKQGEKKTHT